MLNRIRRLKAFQKALDARLLSEYKTLGLVQDYDIEIVPDDNKVAITVIEHMPLERIVVNFTVER